MTGVALLLLAGALDVFLADAASQGSGSEAWIAAQVQARGGPLTEGAEALVVARSREGVAPRVVSDLTGWEPGLPGATSGEMTRIGSTSWFALRVRADRAAWIEYTLAYGDQQVVDPSNAKLIEYAGLRRSLLLMPDYRPGPGVEVPVETPAGRLETLDVRSEAFGSTRRVTVYLPPGFDPALRYPSLYVHDGSLYLYVAQAPKTFDLLIARRLLRPFIAVFSDPQARREEYSMSAAHRRFMAAELLPAVEQRYPTLREPAWRAVLGASRGAEAAMDLALHHPELFGLCAAMAPATRGTDFEARVRALGRQPVRFSLVVGQYDLAFREDGRRVRALLADLGMSVRYSEKPVGHSIPGSRGFHAELLGALGLAPSGVD
jgi:enterochelin esterase-like enzyme